jgi:hypothetical protein
LYRVKKIFELEQLLAKDGGNPNQLTLLEKNKKLTEELNEIKAEKARLANQFEVTLFLLYFPLLRLISFFSSGVGVEEIH